MHENNLKETYLSSYFLKELKFIKDDTTVTAYLEFLSSLTDSSDIEQCIKKYSDFILSLNNKNLSEYVKNLVLNNKKLFDKTSLEKELQILKALFSLSYDSLKQILKDKFKGYDNLFNNLPEFKTGDFLLSVDETESFESTNPNDIFKTRRAFIFDSDLEIKPVKTAQSISFKDLKGYKTQKKVLFDNTKALLENKHVNNILLYGDAGCGKSSSVRALLNEFPDLIMVQIFKDNLINLDKLYQKLYDLPHKFVIFADDISFSDTDGTFSTMKAVLEGSLIECPQNAVIYATSNRRHLVKETFQSRMGDEIHLNDTMNEVSSLSERFGINLLFQRPSNDEFIDIILQLAKDYDIKESDESLIKKAQKLALIKGSRSPRIAKQLMDNLKAGVEI